MNFKFFIIFGSLATAYLVTEAEGKLLSSLFSKGGGGGGCAPAGLFQLPRFSLSSLLCPRPYGGYMMNSWGGSYPSYSGSYMYPGMSGKFVCATPGGSYATAAYPSYGGSNTWSTNPWSYSPNSWYGGSGSWRNDQRKSREYQSKSPVQQQPIQQQQIDSSSDFSSSSNFANSRYSSSVGGKLNTSPSKFVPTAPPRNTNEIVQQQLIQY